MTKKLVYVLLSLFKSIWGLKQLIENQYLSLLVLIVWRMYCFSSNRFYKVTFKWMLAAFSYLEFHPVLSFTTTAHLPFNLYVNKILIVFFWCCPITIVVSINGNPKAEIKNMSKVYFRIGKPFWYCHLSLAFFC